MTVSMHVHTVASSVWNEMPLSYFVFPRLPFAAVFSRKLDVIRLYIDILPLIDRACVNDSLLTRMSLNSLFHSTTLLWDVVHN